MKIKQFKKFLGQIPLIIAGHAFLACLSLFLLALLLGGFLFYKYSILVQKTGLENPDQTFLLKEGVYKEVLEFWQKEEQKFQEADGKEYPDPFSVRLTK